MTFHCGPRSIAIVGCGIAGMAAALFLARAGHRVELFERFETPRPVGSGLLLQPLGLAVLDRLGLGGRIRSAGARIDRLFGLTHPGCRRILDVGYDAIGNGLAGPGIHRANLFGALHGAVAAEGIALTTGTGIAGIDRAADRRPLARAAPHLQRDISAGFAGLKASVFGRIGPNPPT